MARGYGIKNYPELFDYLQHCGEMSFQSPFYCLKTRVGGFVIINSENFKY